MSENTKAFPKYRMVMMSLIERIDNNEFAPRYVLPSENELIQTYNVSRITVRKALDELEMQDYIFRRQGKGTFVNQGRVDDTYYKQYNAGYSSVILGSGKTCKRIQVQKYIKTSDKNELSQNVTTNEDSLYYFRYYLADDKPVFYAESVINHKGFPGIENYDYDFIPISNVIKDIYKGHLYRRDRKVESTKAGRSAVYLDVEENDPVLCLTYKSVVNIEQNIVPFERATVFVRTDVIEILPEHI